MPGSRRLALQVSIHDSHVRRRPVEISQFLRQSPRRLIVLMEGDFLRVADGAQERVQGDREIGVSVRHSGKGIPDDGRYAELFAQLALQAFLRRLAVLDLPSREFPLEGVGHPGGSASAKNPAFPFDEGAGHVEVHA